MQIRLNGEPQEVADGITVAELIAELRLQPKFVAVERNLQLVPRGEHSNCRLERGDQLEIVTLVGGG